MSQVNQQEKRYRWIGFAVAGLAVLGWLFGLYFLSAANEAEEQLAEQVALQATAEDLTVQIADLRDEADQAIVIRDENTGELEAITLQLEQARTDFATLEEETTTLRTERDTMQTELEQGREELAQIESNLTETQNRITETTQELSDIGERLESARQQEADLQATIAELSDEAAQLTEEAATAEQRIQTARDAEASLEQRMQDAQAQQDEIAQARDALQQSVDTLTQQRDNLASDTIAAEEQLQALQSMTSELSQVLAARSAQLQAIEERIGAVLDDTGADVRAQASGLAMATPYVYETVTLIFQPDGLFGMVNTRTDKSVNGAFAISDDIITLSEPDGDMGDATFPMRCGMTMENGELTLEDTDGSCAILGGVVFTQGEP
jgi:uncharacterized coiled-coil DUF342 family protein